MSVCILLVATLSGFYVPCEQDGSANGCPMDSIPHPAAGLCDGNVTGDSNSDDTRDKIRYET